MTSFLNNLGPNERQNWALVFTLMGFPFIRRVPICFLLDKCLNKQWISSFSRFLLRALETRHASKKAIICSHQHVSFAGPPHPYSKSNKATSSMVPLHPCVGHRGFRGRWGSRDWKFICAWPLSHNTTAFNFFLLSKKNIFFSRNKLLICWILEMFWFLILKIVFQTQIGHNKNYFLAMNLIK